MGPRGFSLGPLNLFFFSAINGVSSSVSSLQTTVAGKQDALTFDTTPKSGSGNPVTSGGIYTAIANKMNKVTNVGSSSKPIYINSSGVPTACSYNIGTAASYGVTTSVTSESSDLVTSGAVYTAINSSSEDSWTIATSKPERALFIGLDNSSSSSSKQIYTYVLLKDIRIVYRIHGSGSSSAGYNMLYYSFDLSKGTKLVSHKYKPIYYKFDYDGASNLYFWFIPSNGNWGVYSSSSYDAGKDLTYIDSNYASTSDGYYIMYK